MLTTGDHVVITGGIRDDNRYDCVVVKTGRRWATIAAAPGVDVPPYITDRLFDMTTGIEKDGNYNYKYQARTHQMIADADARAAAFDRLRGTGYQITRLSGVGNLDDLPTDRISRIAAILEETP